MAANDGTARSPGESIVRVPVRKHSSGSDAHNNAIVMEIPCWSRAFLLQASRSDATLSRYK
jgi:hypothetical protein